ncbi:MAG: hypothetical protein CMG74_03595 [Candidatus Marinimicrobia bacterium]|nr:hypothetical protein [Candidatus Neomarinimicrobiota bacterium]|tara:strand:- start:16860 stop:18071 length:1212 start_codon:yes stop_codon:yes gene_type:complete
MKKKLLTLKVAGFTFILFIVLHCTENPIDSDLSHISHNIVDTTIYNISGYSYWIAPNLGSTEKLYFGSKNGLNIDFNIIEMFNSSAWNSLDDSTITIDSILFRIYSNDSTLSENQMSFEMYFSPDSHFDEINSTHMDFIGFELDALESVGTGLINVKRDSLDIFSQTEISWDLLQIEHLMTDSVQSNMYRTFIIILDSGDSTFLELYSREATTGSKDPKIEIFYRQFSQNNIDSTNVDTLSSTIFAKKDLTVIDYNQVPIDSSYDGISLGFGQRMILSFDFSLPQGSLIQNAELILSQDSTLSINGYKLILDPLDQELDTSAIEFIKDPYITLGYPWIMASTIENSVATIGMKYFLQNVNMSNKDNFGLKLLPAGTNDPFHKVPFIFNGNYRKPRLEIIYVVS